MVNKKVSIIIPAYNEAENIISLYKEIVMVMGGVEFSYEIIFINDGSKDDTQNVIDTLIKNDKRVKVIQFRNNFGKAAALQAGFQESKGDYVIQMDADLQDDPKEIPMFIEKLENGSDMVVGWKHKRLDSFVKNKTSNFFNTMTSAFSGVNLHDHNCGFKAYKSEVVKGLNLYGELHRYIAVIVASQGYSVSELPINHRVRNAGKSKYGPIRFVHGFLDLLTVLFITKFRTRPLHLFGYMGMSAFSFGFLISLYLVFVKFIGEQAIGERPLLLFAVMLMIMGVQIAVTGLVGEQIMSNTTKANYVIKKIV